ncbi:uncharacterized protein LOC126836606 [Adelges cooleyi]|uniref:uncharacterized protein LOC126836606 n=1 Tax=Adelges cooleyi TaxID=133065 RepID=UPI0021808695|nr:uncharacterized protein LOC126836606 [Adelges cooleyi]
MALIGKLWTYLLAMSLPAATDRWIAEAVVLKRTETTTMLPANVGESRITGQSSAVAADHRCAARVQEALAAVMDSAGNRRHTGQGQGAAGPPVMDLSGYALHQRLRAAGGAEMYVTGLRAKVMDGGGLWARVDPSAGCRYRPDIGILEARMRFGRPLQVTGTVRIVHPDGRRIGNGIDGPTAGCDMAVRLRPGGRRMGLGFTAAPVGGGGGVQGNNRLGSSSTAGTMTIRTTAAFVDDAAEDDPGDDLGTAATDDGSGMPMLSVHAYNCVGMGHGGREQMQVAATDDGDRYQHILDGSEELLSSNEDEDRFGIDVGFNSAEDDHYSAEADSGRGNRGKPVSPPKQPPQATTPPPQVSTESPPKGTAGFVTVGAGLGGPEPRLRHVQINRPRPLLPAQQHFQQQQQQYPQHVPQIHQIHQLPQPQQPQQQQLYNQPTPMADDRLMMEMEEAFVKGVRRLLARHLERAVQPALRDSLMRRMGYAASYG